MAMLCIVCAVCGRENNNHGLMRFIDGPIDLYLKSALCRQCWGMREYARDVLRARGEWPQKDEWR